MFSPDQVSNNCRRHNGRGHPQKGSQLVRENCRKTGPSGRRAVLPASWRRRRKAASGSMGRISQDHRPVQGGTLSRKDRLLIVAGLLAVSLGAAAGFRHLFAGGEFGQETTSGVQAPMPPGPAAPVPAVPPAPVPSTPAPPLASD